MNPISTKKVLVSYFISSSLILLVSAITNSAEAYGGQAVNASLGQSQLLGMLVYLMMALGANAILHMVFYYGGFKSSPIKRGVTAGAVLGLAYFAVTVFAFGAYNITTDPLGEMATAMAGRMFEYTTGGIVTAIVSVSDIHKWGLLRAF